MYYYLWPMLYLNLLHLLHLRFLVPHLRHYFLVFMIEQTKVELLISRFILLKFLIAAQWDNLEIYCGLNEESCQLLFLFLNIYPLPHSNFKHFKDLNLLNHFQFSLWMNGIAFHHRFHNIVFKHLSEPLLKMEF